MVVPPLPWSNIFSGGYLSQRAAIMRLRGPKHHLKRLKDAHACGELQQVWQAGQVYLHAKQPKESPRAERLLHAPRGLPRLTAGCGSMLGRARP